MKSPNNDKNKINIEVKNLVLKRESKSSSQKDVTILKGINLTFNPGTLNAIMAPNGHGKSTFLNALFGKVDSDVMISGDIYYKGKEREIETWFEDASYVEQGDYDLKDQTVREALEFSARIRGRDIDCEEYKKDFDEIVKALDLKKILDKRSDSISGGEKKRTMIAIELLANKKVLILDEPTADLDSFLASKLLEFLNKRAKERGLIIVSSIHQPSDDLIQTFDNILLLNEGRQIYYGDQKNLLPYLRSKGLIKKDKTSTSNFLFNLMYDKGEDGNFGGFENEIINESNGIVQSSNPVKVSRKYNFIFNFSLMKFILLLKRFYQIAFKKKGFYIQVIIAFLIPIIFKLLVKYNFKELSKEQLRIEWNISNSGTYANSVQEFEEFFAKYLCSILYFIFDLFIQIVCLDSFLYLQKQTKIEVSKSYYSPFTLYLSIFSSELLFSLLIYLCFALSLYFYNPESYLTFNFSYHLLNLTFLNAFYKVTMMIIRPYFRKLDFLILILNFFKLFISNFSNYLIGDNSICKIIRSELLKNILKGLNLVYCTLLIPSDFYRILYSFCERTFQKNALRNIFKDLIALLGFGKSSNLAENNDVTAKRNFALYQNFSENNPLNWRQRDDDFEILKNADYRWICLGLIFSLISSFIISYLVFMVVYSPSLSVKNFSSKNKNKNSKSRKSILNCLFTKYSLYTVSIIVFILITYYGFFKNINRLQNKPYRIF